MAHLFTTSLNDRIILLRSSDFMQESHQSATNNNHHQKTSPYHSVQTLSFQIYTGGAPAFITDKVTGEKRPNPECVGCKLSLMQPHIVFMDVSTSFARYIHHIRLT